MSTGWVSLPPLTRDERPNIAQGLSAIHCICHLLCGEITLYIVIQVQTGPRRDAMSLTLL